MRRHALLIALLLCLTGCVGYQVGYGDISCRYRTFCVPFVEGDEYGELTRSLVEEVSARTGLRYQSAGSELVLIVRVIEAREKNIGFRYDTDAVAVDTRNVIPAETRLELFVEVCLYDCACEQVVMGPKVVSGRLDYDHDHYSNSGGVNLFSLGQLNDIDIAQDMARRPAFREVAKNVADYIVNGWFNCNPVCCLDDEEEL